MLKTLIRASRPEFWILHPLVFLGGAILSGAGYGPLVIALALLFSFPYCLFLYGINDYHDLESDRRNARKKEVFSEEALERMRPYAFFMAGALLAVSLPAGAGTSIAMAALLLISYIYSAPPRLKELPPLDSLSNGLIYIILPFTIGWTLGVGPYPWKILLVGLCGAGLHAITTIVDHIPDKDAGDRTFSTVFGKRSAASFALAAFIFTALFTWSIPIYIYLSFCALIALILLVRPSEDIALKGSFCIYLGAIGLAIYHIILAST